MYAIRHLFWLSAAVSAFCLGGCEIPGGASTAEMDTGRYQVQVPFREVGFSATAQAQTVSGVTVSVTADGIKPLLYYRYDVSGRVNGSYAVMPNPPMLYTVRKVPFYKADPGTVMVHVELQNGTGEVVRASQAICSFDIDGKTVASTPLSANDLLPGHVLDLQLQGPGQDQFDGKTSGTMTVWVYGLTADKNQALHWQMDYTVTQQDRQAWGEIVGQTPAKAEADHYKDLVEPADSDATVSPPPGG